MSTLISILALVALGHFAFEAIVLPSIRVHLRNRLFENRDRLRQMIIEEKADIDAEVFELLDGAINFYLPRLQQLTISLRVDYIEAIRSDEEFRDRVKEKRRKFEANASTEAKEIHSDVSAICESAFVANMGSWFVYLIPIAFVLVALAQLSEMAKNLVSMPQSQALRLMPSAA